MNYIIHKSKINLLNNNIKLMLQCNIIKWKELVDQVTDRLRNKVNVC